MRRAPPVGHLFQPSSPSNQLSFLSNPGGCCGTRSPCSRRLPWMEAPRGKKRKKEKKKKKSIAHVRIEASRCHFAARVPAHRLLCSHEQTPSPLPPHRPQQLVRVASRGALCSCGSRAAASVSHRKLKCQNKSTGKKWWFES